MIFSIDDLYKNHSGIYAIRNSINSKVYIGSAHKLRRRYSGHRRDLLKGQHHSIHLQRFCDKNGIDCLSFELLELCDKEQCLEKEQLYLDKLKSFQRRLGYNIAKDAAAPTRGMKMSEKTKQLLRVINTGKKMPREAVLKAALALKGYKHTEETRKNMSVSKTGLKIKPQTAETKAKRAAKLKGRKQRPEVVQARALAQKGMKQSEESKKNKSIAATGHIVSEASRQKASRTMKAKWLAKVNKGQSSLFD